MTAKFWLARGRKQYRENGMVDLYVLAQLDRLGMGFPRQWGVC